RVPQWVLVALGGGSADLRRAVSPSACRSGCWSLWEEGARTSAVRCRRARAAVGAGRSGRRERGPPAFGVAERVPQWVLVALGGGSADRRRAVSPSASRSGCWSLWRR